MRRKKSKAVAEGYGPVPQDKSGLCGLPTEKIRRIFFEELEKSFHEWTNQFDLRLENIKEKDKNHRLAGLEHEAGQSRLATEADVETDKKTRKCTEGTGAADRAKHNGDSSSARRVDHGPTSLTSSDQIAELPLAPEKCIGDAFVNKCAEVPKPHLPPVEVRVLSSAAGGLPAGITSTTMRTIFPLPLFLGASVKRPIKKDSRTNFKSLPLPPRGRLFK